MDLPAIPWNYCAEHHNVCAIYAAGGLQRRHLMSDDPHTPVAAASLHGQKLAPDGSKLVLVEWTIRGGSAEDPEWMAPLHIHHNDDEAWYVLEGRLRVRVGGDDHDVPAGGAVIGPRGVPHVSPFLWGDSSRREVSDGRTRGSGMRGMPGALV
jgi:mannose-6-phosphate isomerase-like protein (cupin superfamily)